MRRILTLVILLLFAFPIFSVQADEVKPLEVGISFDWISKTQLQRDENIAQIQNMLFSDNAMRKYEKKQFKKEYAPFLKNNNYANDYQEISDGKKEDADKYYCGFYWNKLMVAYGIQYKNNMRNIYYYDALGKMRWVDVFSEKYPTFPYWSYQYSTSGKPVAAYYYISDADQYVFNPDKKFIGRWYNEKMYNKDAKVIMTRSNY